MDRPGVVVVAYCDVKSRQKKAIPVQGLAFLQVGAMAAAVDAHKPAEQLEAERRWRQRLHRRAVEKARKEEANRPTIQKYAEYLRLHPKREERTKVDTVRYQTLGQRHGWHGRPEHVVFRDRPAPQRCPAARRSRVPRNRRVRTLRSSRDGPARSTDDDPLDPPARVLYAHAAAFRADRRVARWLEAWADEALVGA